MTVEVLDGIRDAADAAGLAAVRAAVPARLAKRFTEGS